MNKIKKELIEFGIIDSLVENIVVDEWFENVTFSFDINGNGKKLICKFENCFEISLKHDVSYSKGKKPNKELDYKYFVQSVEVENKNGFLTFQISGWPLNGVIVCKTIKINKTNNIYEPNLGDDII